MANKFEIAIVAVDRATAVVRKVSQALNRITAPVSRLKASMRSLSAELGLDRIGKGLMGIGQHARNITQRFSAMLTPLSALLGFSTLAGVGVLAKKFAEFAWGVVQASKATGVAVPKLQALDGAGKLLGISAETTNASLAQMMNTLQDARFGRNQTALTMLRQLGVGFRLTKDGAVDVVRSFDDIARAIANPKIANNPATQNLIARTFGLEQMLPLLRQGPAAINKLMDAVKASGYVMGEAATKRATDFQQSLWLLDITATGLRNTIGDKLIPIFGPMVEKLTAWVAANRDLVASKVAEVASGFAAALRSIDWGAVVGGVKEFIAGAKSAVEFVGGWGNAMKALIVLMNAGAIVAVLNLTRSVIGLGAALTGTLLKGLASTGIALAGTIIGPAAAAEAAVSGLAGALMTAGAALGALGTLLAVGGIGAIAGTLISKAAEGTKVGDTIGAGVAKTLAFFGNDEARASVERMNGSTTPLAGASPAAAASPYKKPPPASPAAAGAATAGNEPTRIELILRGLPQGTGAVVTGGAPVALRIGDAMPAVGTW